MPVITEVICTFNRKWQPARVTRALNQQGLISLHRNKQDSILMVNPQTPMQGTGRHLDDVVITAKLLPQTCTLFRTIEQTIATGQQGR